MRYAALLLLLLLVVVGCQSGRQTDRTFTEEAWQSEVLGSKEPVLVDFWATWCGPCRLMEQPVASLGRDFKVVRVNVDQNTDLSRRYRIEAIPVLLIFKDGQIAERFLGVT